MLTMYFFVFKTYDGLCDLMIAKPEANSRKWLGLLSFVASFAQPAES
jgi:hypothetical protein